MDNHFNHEINELNKKNLADQELFLELKTLMNEHPLWNNRLLKACELGHLSKEDFKVLFEQYFLYSKNFTRYLCAVMANMENDLHRSQLSENIWEEGGGEDIEKRHSEIFRQFLIKGLGVEIDQIQFADFTKQFMSQYLNYCLTKPALEGTAFLSLGTEAIVARLYQILLDGMINAGVEKEHLHFFELHIECDDDHAETLENILMSFSHLPNFKERCIEGFMEALNLRNQFFNDLFSLIYQNRISDKIDKINAKKSLFDPETLESEIKFNPFESVSNFDDLVYFNKNESKNIEFTVNRAPFKSEVLDARIVKIAPHKTNERHTHAHETIFYILEGEGKVIVDKMVVDVKKGESVFVPRWSVHQTQNTSDFEMIVLAITDFYLTGKALIGNYNSTARMKK